MVDSGKLRFIVIDGSTVQEPGATATTYRLHIAIDLINLSLHQVEVTTDKESENLDHYTQDCPKSLNHYRVQTAPSVIRLQLSPVPGIEFQSIANITLELRFYH